MTCVINNFVLISYKNSDGSGFFQGHADFQQVIRYYKILTYNDKDLQKQSYRGFRENDVLKNFDIVTGKHLCWSLFQARNFNKKRLQHRFFPVNIAKF